jgi:hypothetical protein
MKEAKLYATTNEFERALASLMAVPMASTDCYNKALDESYAVFKKIIDRDCKLKLNEANAIWSAGQSYESASQQLHLFFRLLSQKLLVLGR